MRRSCQRFLPFLLFLFSGLGGVAYAGPEPTPSVSAELSLGATPALYPSPDSQANVHVATDGTGYLAVWQDLRANDTLIFGARIDGTGKLIDPVGFPISRHPARTGSALSGVSFDGTNYLVGFRGTDGLKAVRVSPVSLTTKVIDTDDIAVFTGAMNPRVDVAFDGTNHHLLWQSATGIYTARVSKAGAVLDAAPVQLSTSSGSAVRGIACTAGTCLAVWGGVGVRIDTAGTVLDATPLTFGSDVGTQLEGVKVTAVGGDFYVGANISATSFRLVRVTAAGGVTQLPAHTSGQLYGLSSDGTNIVASFNGEVRHIDTNNVLVTSNAIGTSSRGVGCRSLTDCTTAYLSTADYPPSSPIPHSLVFGVRLSNGVVGAPFRLGSAAARQEIGGTATLGNEALVGWWEGTGTTHAEDSGALYVSRIGSNGAALDTGIRISDFMTPLDKDGTPNPDLVFTPAIASDGTAYFATWYQPAATPGEAKLFGRRISASGSFLDAAPIQLMEQSAVPNRMRLFYDGTNYVVFWDTLFVRVSPAGVVLDPTPKTLGSFRFSSVGFNGTHYLAVFDTNSGNQVGTYDLYGVRMDKNFEVVDPVPFPITTAPKDQSGAIIASDGTDFFVVWSDARNATVSTSSLDVYGTRVTGAGTVLDPNGLPVAVTPIGKQMRAASRSLAYVAKRKKYVVGWMLSIADGRSAHAGNEVRATEIDPGAGTNPPLPSVLLAPVPYTNSPSVALRPFGGSKLLLSYDRLDLDTPFGIKRVHTRVVDFDGPSPNGDAGMPEGGADSGTPSPDGAASSSSSSGSSGSVTPDGGAEPEAENTSCSCRAAQRRSGGPSGLVAFASLALFALRRRRR